MSIDDVPAEDRWCIWMAAIICAAIVAIVVICNVANYVRDSDPIINGYEQVADPNTGNVLWKKSRKEQ